MLVLLQSWQKHQFSSLCLSSVLDGTGSLFNLQLCTEEMKHLVLLWLHISTMGSIIGGRFAHVNWSCTTLSAAKVLLCLNSSCGEHRLSCCCFRHDVVPLADCQKLVWKQQRWLWQATVYSFLSRFRLRWPCESAASLRVPNLGWGPWI